MKPHISQVSRGVPFDNTSTEISSDNVQSVLEEIDFHSGLSIIDSNVTVRTARQMIVFNMITLDGDLTLNGDLWLA